MAEKRTKINRKKDGNGKASFAHSGPSVLIPHLESIVNSWIQNQRKTLSSASTTDVVSKAQQILPILKWVKKNSTLMVIHVY